MNFLRACSAALLLFILSTVFSCDNFSLPDSFKDAAKDTPLAIDPSSASVSRGSMLTFTASGGTPPYTFSMVSGEGFFEQGTGNYWGNTTDPSGGLAVVSVQDSGTPPAESLAEVTITPLYVPVAISPENQVLMVGAESIFSASGGSPPFVFSVASNGGGASIDPVSGAYTARKNAGTDTVTVTDGIGTTASSEVSVYAAPTLIIRPATVSINAESSFIFTVTGGAGGNVYSVQAGAGNFDSPGIYTAPAGSGTATVRVTDKVDTFAEAVIEYVTGGPLVLSPSSVEVPENGSLLFVGAGGASNSYLFELTAGFGVLSTQDPHTALYTASGVGAVAVNEDTRIRLSDGGVSAPVEASVRIVPAAPTNLSATVDPGDKKRITLTWTDNSPGTDVYYVEYKQGISGTYTPGELAATRESHVFDLLPDRWYGFRVRAYKDLVYSDYSNEAYAFTSND